MAGLELITIPLCNPARCHLIIAGGLAACCTLAGMQACPSPSALHLTGQLGQLDHAVIQPASHRVISSGAGAKHAPAGAERRLVACGKEEDAGSGGFLLRGLESTLS